MHRARALPDQLVPLTQVRAHRADLVRYPVGAAQQPVAHQLPDPLAIHNIALASTYLFGRPRIHQIYLEARPVEHLEHRDPVNARRLHRHLAHAARCQPLRHRLQIRRERPEVANRFVEPRRIHRYIVLALADVDPRAVRMHHLQIARYRLVSHSRFLHDCPTVASGMTAAVRSLFHTGSRPKGRATNVRTPITVRAKLACGPKHHCFNGLLPGATVFSRLNADLHALFVPCASSSRRAGFRTRMEHFFGIGFPSAERARGTGLLHAKRARCRWILSALKCFKGAGGPHLTAALIVQPTVVPRASARRGGNFHGTNSPLHFLVSIQQSPAPFAAAGSDNRFRETAP